MKKLVLISFLIPSLSLFAQENISLKRERLFHCLNFGGQEEVEELYIVKSKRGTNTFYEVEVPYKVENQKKTFYRKLNLREKYQGRVLLFTTGNYRVKIDKALPKEKKYKTFVRLPRFNVHSTQWFCKDN